MSKVGSSFSKVVTAAAVLAIAVSAYASNVASDNAFNAAYTGGNINGQNGGTGFGAWIVNPITNDGTHGSFLGTSTLNDGGGLGIDTINGPSGFRAWGAYANNGALADGVRPFTGGALSVGQTFSVDFDTGSINAGGTVGFGLQNAAGQKLFELYYVGGDLANSYKSNDGTGQHNVGIGFTGNGLHFDFTLTDATHYAVTLTPKPIDGSAVTWTGSLIVQGDQGIRQFRYFNANAPGADPSGGPNYDAFFNNLAIIQTFVPAASAATDDASDPAYSGGWTNGSNGGTGFGAWSQMTTIANVNNNGFFIGSSISNGIAIPSSGIDTGDKSWGLYANGHNQVHSAFAEAYRPFTGALIPGQTVVVKMDNGRIDSGGMVGITLLNQDPADVNSIFTALPGAETRFGLTFSGGDNDYRINLGNFAGGSNVTVNTGVGFTDGGLSVAFTLNSNDTFSVSVNGSTPITGTLGGHANQTINGIALFNYITGATTSNDLFFNSLSILQPTSYTPAKLAFDMAADSAYAGGWTNSSTGGYGWGGPWFFNTAMSGSSGQFLGTSQANGSADGNIDTLKRAWGLWADNGGQVSARRDFSQPLQPGQSFAIDMDNGYIDNGGSVGFTLTGNGDPGASSEFDFFFRGGDTNYTITTGKFIWSASTNTGVAFTSKGVHVLLTLGEAGAYSCAITPNGGSTTIIEGTGLAASEGLGHVALFNNNAGSGPAHDAFFNNITIYPAPRLTGFGVVGGTNAVVSFVPSAPLRHEVQYRDDLLAGDWSTLTSNITGSGETTLQIPDWFIPAQSKRFYRIKARQ